MICFSSIFKRRKSSHQQNVHKGEILDVQNIMSYSYKELRLATGEFSLANKVGEGGFGSVYKGTLKDGKVVAVKVLSSESRQGAREFLNELLVISDVVHENLVRLCGFCTEGNHRFLVYDYLENNSLAQTLLGRGRCNIQFSWRTRSRICIGIAQGLAFLHEEVKPHIVHRDIKASNILLDKDLTPKISDFGFAKLFPDNMSHISTRVAGTIGYLAPEYAVRGHLTRKADIYSFGVLLLEIVSGTTNIDTRLPYEDQFLIERVIVRLARSLDFIKVAAARTLIVWIVGEYNSSGQIISKILPTLLKYLAWCFVSEEVETKHQILNTAAKVVLCAQGEEVPTFKVILGYIIELAKHDLDYDIRDRARMVEKLIPYHITSLCQEVDSSYPPENEEISREFAGNIFGGKIPPGNDTLSSFRFYLPGSLSQIVLHAAPGYVPLPKPCSLRDNDMNPYSGLDHESKVATGNVGFESNDADSYSGSSVEESGSYDSEHSFVSSVEESGGAGSERDPNDNGHNASLLSINDSGNDKVPLSDSTVNNSQMDQSADENMTMSLSKDMAELMSKSALESWLDEQPAVPSVQKVEQQPSARISITGLRSIANPKIYTLLDPANGNGLRVECTFSTENSPLTPSLTCVEFTFGNYSTQPLTGIVVKDGENGGVESANRELEKPESVLNTDDLPIILPMEEIASLDPGQTVKRTLQARFHHHLLPLKLNVSCNGRKHLIKLWPDIGYFVRPHSMNIESFTDIESNLSGVFEYAKRCVYTDHIKEPEQEDESNTDKILVVSRSLASKVLSNANVYLVSVDMPVSFRVDDASGLCLRFSSEILSSLKPCLITLMVEGKCSEALDITVKVNCEETIFGLNLLNRVVAFLA